MNDDRDNIGASHLPALTRRGLFGAAALAAFPAAATPEIATDGVSVDDFLVRASASEKAWYHANALVELMGEMHRDFAFRSHINHDHAFVLIVGDRRAVRA